MALAAIDLGGDVDATILDDAIEIIVDHVVLGDGRGYVQRKSDDALPRGGVQWDAGRFGIKNTACREELKRRATGHTVVKEAMRVHRLDIGKDVEAVADVGTTANVNVLEIRQSVWAMNGLKPRLKASERRSKRNQNHQAIA